jgi:1-acyl-sn-glycerol-3-phosphate acyltransferase
MLRPLRTVYEYMVLYYGLGLLGLICLSWTVVAAALFPLLPRRWGEALGRYVIMAGFRLYLAAIAITGTCRFDLSALDPLKSQGPMIIAPNHPSLLDAVMVLSRLPDVVCVMKASLLDNVFLGAGARLARYIRNDSLVRLVGKASESLRGGSQLLVFPEGTRTTRVPVNAFKGAVAGIAKRAAVPVQTVFIESDSPYLCKGWPLFRKPSMPMYYRVRLGRRFDPPADSHVFQRELERYFNDELGYARNASTDG